MIVSSSRIALTINLFYKDPLRAEVALADGLYHHATTKRDLHLAKEVPKTFRFFSS